MIPRTPRFRLTADAGLGRIRHAAPGGGFFSNYFPYRGWRKAVAWLVVAALPVMFVVGGINGSLPDRPGEEAALAAFVLLLSVMGVKVVEHAFLPALHRERGEPTPHLIERRARQHARCDDFALLLLVASGVTFGFAVASGFSFR